MHKFLRLDNLSLLPISVRRFASPAANGSVADFNRLLELLEDTTEDKTYTLCLPVFYANLNPARIPTDEDLSSPSVTLAIMALNGLHAIKKDHMPAGPDLWPRIWKWATFLFVYRDTLPELEDFESVGFDLLLFLACFGRDPTTSVAIYQTPSVRVSTMYAWESLLDTRNGAQHPGFNHLGRCFYTLAGMMLDGQTLAEVLEGAGGPANLASVVIRSINLFVPNPGMPLSDPTLLFLKGLVCFLSKIISVYDELSVDPADPTRNTVSPALISAGVHRALTSIICTVSRPHAGYDDAPRILPQFFSVLLDLLYCPHAMSEALGAGLFEGIVFSGSLSTDHQDLSDELKTFLDTTVSVSTVHYRITAQLEQQLSEVEQIAKAPAFRNSPTYQPWSAFVVLAHERIALLNDLKSAMRISLRACDNLECQKADWTNGNHREGCPAILAFKLRTTRMSTRNLSFMCALMHKDAMTHPYLEGKSTSPITRWRRLVHEEEVRLETLLTVIDYSHGCSPYITLSGPYGQESQDEDGDVHWEEHKARTARSFGRMDLHLMIFRDGTRKRRLMFPQRSDRPGMHHGLLRLIKQQTGPDLQDEVQRLLAVDEGLVKIHQY
ncbi:hypothetical protein C8R43DRAFT_956849 [Mycena crocata]|nr:hypothetical protein C8R43DRAFT_956849 [Mycena crocata]